MKPLVWIAATTTAICGAFAITIPVLVGISITTLGCTQLTPDAGTVVAPGADDERARYSAAVPRAAGCAGIFNAGGSGVWSPGTPVAISDAVARSLSYVGLRSGFAGKCDRLACRAFNYLNSGYTSASAHWQIMALTGHAHPGDRCPPTGAFVFWATSHPEGHVAFVVHGDTGCDPDKTVLVSNDVGDAAAGAHGGVYLVTLAQIESGFVTTAGYRGWSDPVCAGTLLPADAEHPISG